MKTLAVMLKDLRLIGRDRYGFIALLLVPIVVIMVVATATLEVVVNDWMSPLFQATADATEEAIYNSLLRAETVRGYRGVVPALPIDSTVMILKRHGAIPR